MTVRHVQVLGTWDLGFTEGLENLRQQRGIVIALRQALQHLRQAIGFVGVVLLFNDRRFVRLLHPGVLGVR